MRSDRALAQQNESVEKAKIWNDSKSSYEMERLLDGLAVRVAQRKIRLFGIECCRQIKGFTKDPDCQKAILLCEAAIENTVDEEELTTFREQLDIRRLRIIHRLEHSQVDEWAISAAMGLLETDRAYFTDSGPSLRRIGSSAMSAGVRTGRVLSSISDVRQSDLENAGRIITGQAELLDEIVGNPFELIEIESCWLNEDVVRLANEHDRTPSRELMLLLHNALCQAGCDNQKMLNHCLVPWLHPRGCWLIDLLLGKPTFATTAIDWDYTLFLHGTSDSTLREIKRRLREIASTKDGSLKKIESKDGATFANWLEEQGLPNWAEFARCAAEISEPTSVESYASAVARYDMMYACGRYWLELPNVYMSASGQRYWPRWWNESYSDMDFGLPSAINATPPGAGKLHAIPLIDAITNTMMNLPVRDIDFEGDYFDDLPNILSSTAGKAITTFRSKVSKDDSGISPFGVLKESDLTRSLRRLVLKSWLDDEAVRELGNIEFESLQELDFLSVCGVSCETDTLSCLVGKKWFQKLRSIRMNFRGNCCNVAMPLLSRLEQLTTLAIADSREEIFSHGSERISFPKLQRLYLAIGEIKHEIENICNYSLPNLIEFWLDSNRTIGKNLIKLINGELLRTISILRLNTPELSSKVLDALLVAPFAQNIRVLELHAMTTKGPSKASKKIFADPDAMPRLSALAINKLYATPDYSECAQWLRSFSSESLRHLTLEQCKLDDNCLNAILENLCFRNLESLTISEGYGESHVTPEGAERFLRSLDFPNLRSLHFHRTKIGNRIECLSDLSCVPSVEFASFSDTLASEEVVEKIKRVRPAFVVSR